MEALLVAIWAGICAIDDVGTQMIRRPLLIAPVVGIIMGDLYLSLIIGATLEIMWMGVGNVGAYSAPDMISGTAIATALGITTGEVATAIALAVPTSLLAQQLLIFYRSFIVILNPIARRIAGNGLFGKIYRIHIVPVILAFLVRAVPTYIAISLGANAIETAVASLPANIIGGLGVAGKIIPAVGISLLMIMMIKKAELWVFLIAGFALTVYLNIPILAITLIALPLALIYDIAVTSLAAKNTTASPISIEEEEYDI